MRDRRVLLELEDVIDEVRSTLAFEDTYFKDHVDRGKRARAFESYFNDQALVLRTTKLYNFPEETSMAFKALAEWYLSSPTGISLQINWNSRRSH
ncbi:unnamed protein product [Penicillium roqueforti FM164]|uniref:Genomic scaffold, ProqFM164S01 n=1 Tax=Penicillium roqueforti (strain FM164) TaxID=1365484 RepID=W6PVS8_PENRF|nr:unnamed protein product [Penicillium roqueforti FM164]